MKKPNPQPFDYVRDWQQRRSELGWWHSFELPDATIIEGVCGLASQRDRIAQFPIPKNLTGKRVLDIGAWDGWFSFEMERRGAEVLAIDNWDNPRFHEMRALLNSRADYRVIDMYDLTPDRVGRFDIVLFMGVLYHLKHPLLALERVCALTTEMAAIDSFVIRDEHRPGAGVEQRPVMEFYETNEFGGQTDNWVAPSVPCLMAFCRTAGFAQVELRSLLEKSACIACYRKWDSTPSAQEGPELLDAVHDTNGGINFDSRRDEYVNAWFVWKSAALSCDDVKPEVGGLGVRPIDVKRFESDVWQVKLKLPPGLMPGWHDLRIRVAGSLPGSARAVAVDMPLEQTVLQINDLTDGATWTPGRVDLRQGLVLTLWVNGLSDNADRNNVRVAINGERAEVTYVASRRGQSGQINVKVPADTPEGSATLEITLQGHTPVSSTVEVVR